MKNPLSTRIPMYKTTSLGDFPEQVENYSYASASMLTGTITPKYRAPEFVIKRDLTNAQIQTILLYRVGGSPILITFDHDTEIGYYQDEEFMYAAFFGKDLAFNMPCGAYYYTVVFQGESDFYYSQYINVHDIEPNTVPKGYIRITADADCTIAKKFPHAKWANFKHELWLMSEVIEPQHATQREVELDDDLNETIVSVRIDRSHKIVAKASIADADALNLMQLYTLHDLKVWTGNGAIGFAEPEKVIDLQVNDEVDYTINHEEPLVRVLMKYANKGLFSNKCCDESLICLANYVPGVTIEQVGSSNTFNITVDASNYPSGHWVVVQSKRSSSSTWGNSSPISEATVLAGAFQALVSPTPPDEWDLRIIVKNHVCEYTSIVYGPYEVT